ncbi:hypothetical protein B0H11DRAFT_2316415 [Mycena galericulata]|nr:hypothetical protein B0H11DRAFT_2316415 [Mycena galericulata]
MDPLRLADLPLTEDWNLFQPDMKGYLPPQQLQLHPGFEDPEAHTYHESLKSQIREFMDPYYMRNNNVPFLALSVEQPFPITSLAIRGEKFTVPLSSREMAYLTGTILGDADGSKNTIPGTELYFLNDSVHKAIARVVSSALRKIDASRAGFMTEKILATVDVLKAGSHELSNKPINENHIATVLVILPSSSAPADIRVQARHAAITAEVRLRRDLLETASAIGTYTGVSDGRIDIGAGGEIICLTYYIFGPRNEDASVIPRLENLSGALPPLRDAFCLWRHNLNSGADATTAPALMLFVLDRAPLAARDFRGYDATRLCHLAPLAKAYGFTMYIGSLVHTMSTEQEVYHDPKDYLGLYTDFDPSVLYMSDKPDVEYEFEALRTLAGVTIAEPKLLELAAEMLSKGDSSLMDIDPKKDYEIEDDSIYSAQVVLTHNLLSFSAPGGLFPETVPCRWC